jgi:two-component system, chemotaxis family, chemotaxis protein CheY
MGGVIAAPSPSMRRILRNTLHRFGIDDIQEFPDGLKALEACTETTSFVITAWTMEGFDGIELAKQLRATPETAHIPILMVTVRNSKDDVIIAREAGISAYMLQPFLAEQFRSKIETLLHMCVRPTSDSRDGSSDRAAAADADDSAESRTDAVTVESDRTAEAERSAEEVPAMEPASPDLVEREAA